jgi:hypothetical protein
VKEISALPLQTVWTGTSPLLEATPDTHFQDTLARKGSPGQVSIAQNGMGKRTQFKPAPAISAMSCSVYNEMCPKQAPRR